MHGRELRFQNSPAQCERFLKKSNQVILHVLAVDFTNVNQSWSQDIFFKISRSPRPFYVGLSPPLSSGKSIKKSYVVK